MLEKIKTYLYLLRKTEKKNETKIKLSIQFQG